MNIPVVQGNILEFILKQTPVVVLAAIAFWVFLEIIDRHYELTDSLIRERQLQTIQLQKVVGNCMRMADSRKEIEMVLEGSGLDDLEEKEIEKLRRKLKKKFER